MTKRTVIAVTDAQAVFIMTAIKNRLEDGSGSTDTADIRLSEAIRRQLRGDLNGSERTSIYKAATKFVKEASHDGD